MARILAISSQVVRGHIGLSAAAPALQRLGHEVWPMPTILLSSHPGHPRFAAAPMDPALLAGMAEALEANGWLGQVDAVLTGYLPSAAHVDVAAGIVERVRRLRPGVLYLCDPVLGDDPKGLYIAREAAERVRDRLISLADLATPNRMELEFLTGRPVRGIDEAARALECLMCGGGIATSIPGDGEPGLANVLSLGPDLAITRVARRDQAPHGTGDLMAALIAGHIVSGAAPGRALALATAAIDRVLAASYGDDELQLTAALGAIAEPAPWPIEEIGWGPTGGRRAHESCNSPKLA